MSKAWKVRFDLKCKARDPQGNFAGLCVVGSTYNPYEAADMLMDSFDSFSRYEYWIDTELEEL